MKTHEEENNEIRRLFDMFEEELFEVLGEEKVEDIQDFKTTIDYMLYKEVCRRCLLVEKARKPNL